MASQPQPWRKLLVATIAGVTAGTAVHCAAEDDSEDEGADTGGEEEELEGAAAESASVQWGSFGHDLFNTRHNSLEDTITAGTVSGLTLTWEAVGAEVTSTPAVVDGIVYYGDWSGRLYARRLDDGSEVWSSVLGRQIPGESDGTFFTVAASPLVTDDMVYVGDQDSMFHAVDRATGEERWSVELDDHQDAGCHGSAVFVDGIVIVGVSSGELGRSLDDYTFRGSIVAYDATNGAEFWRVYVSEDDETSGAGVSVWSSPAVDRERQRVYIGTGNTYEEPASPHSDAIISIDYTTGEVDWVRQFTEGDVYTLLMQQPQGPDADIGAAPNLFRIGDIDVVGAGDKAGAYAALERDTGEVIWMTQLTEGSHLGGVMVAAAYADERIYVASNRWPSGFDTETIFIPDFENPDNTSEVFALDANTGQVLWSVPMPHPTLGAMAVAGGVVYTGTADGQLRGLSTETGDELWTDDAGHSMASGQTISDGHLLTGHGFQFIGLTPGAVGEAGGLRVYSLE